MLRINSFNPMSNFTRATYDFLDEKIVVRMKSLVTEYDDEVRYEDIKHIEITNAADRRWIWLGLAVIVTPFFLTWFFSAWSLLNNPIFLIITKALAVIGLVLCLPAFHKNMYYFFRDQARHNLIVIKDDINNYKAVDQALYLVRQKSTILSDTNPENPLPNSHPAYEHIDFNFKDYLNNSVTRFYEDKLVNTEKSLVEEAVTEVNYCELSGKILRVKTWDGGWSSLGCGLALIFFSAIWFLKLFFPGILQDSLPNSIWLILGALPLLLVLLSLVKREAVLFYGLDDKTIWRTRPNSRDRQMLDDIVEYVKGKTLSSARLRS